MKGRTVPARAIRVTDEDLLANGQLRELVARHSQSVEQQLAGELKAIIANRVPNERRATQLLQEILSFLSNTVIEQRPTPAPELLDVGSDDDVERNT